MSVCVLMGVKLVANGWSSISGLEQCKVNKSSVSGRWLHADRVLKYICTYICMYWWTYGRAFYKQMKANWTVKACLSTFIYPNDRESLSKRTHTSMELNWSKNIYVCMYKIKLRGILHMNEWRVNVWGGVRAYWSCYLLFINRCHTCKC